MTKKNMTILDELKTITRDTKSTAKTRDILMRAEIDFHEKINLIEKHMNGYNILYNLIAVDQFGFFKEIRERIDRIEKHLGGLSMEPATKMEPAPTGMNGPNK